MKDAEEQDFKIFWKGVVIMYVLAIIAWLLFYYIYLRYDA
jgi:hypothetical protein